MDRNLNCYLLKNQSSTQWLSHICCVSGHVDTLPACMQYILEIMVRSSLQAQVSYCSKCYQIRKRNVGDWGRGPSNQCEAIFNTLNVNCGHFLPMKSVKHLQVEVINLKSCAAALCSQIYTC